MEGKFAVEGGHYGLEEGAERGRARDAFASGLEEDGVWGIEVQDGFQLFGAKVLDPGFADFGEGDESRGLTGGNGGGGKCLCEDGGEGQQPYGGAARTVESRRFDWRCGRDIHGGSD